MVPTVVELSVQDVAGRVMTQVAPVPSETATEPVGAVSVPVTLTKTL